MREALFYKKLKDKKVQCFLCPHNCIISPSKRGICNVRENNNGILYSLTYGEPCTINIDPIEKKPIYNFLPGTKTLTIATMGCNLSCKQCQNYHISKTEIFTQPFVPPEKIIELALKNKTPSISYSYTEPTIFYEYMLDIAKLAKKNKIKNILVSNGYISQKPLKELCKYIDAANIDLKAFTDEFYKKTCKASLKPVLETLKTLKKEKVHLEITNLIIPTLNDNLKDIEKMCIWIKENLGKDTPLHFSKFFPMYQLKDIPQTPLSTLEKVKKIADKYLSHVYLGNI